MQSTNRLVLESCQRRGSFHTASAGRRHALSLDVESHRAIPMPRLLVPLALFAAIGLAQAGEPARFGKPLPTSAPVAVADAVAAFDQHAGKPLRFSGRITEVCQAEGCWLVLDDNG